jgi:DNA processing protein
MKLVVNMNKEKIFANALNQEPKIGASALRRIKNFFHSFESAWKAPFNELKNIIKTNELEDFRKKIDPEKEYALLEKAHVNVLLKEELPELLQEIADPPQILYVKGNLPDDKVKTPLAVVGTRKLSSYGREAALKIINQLKDYNLTIVSGLALGIDTLAHRGALENDLATVAVLGSGLKNEIIYPRSNKKLAEEIVEKGGALVSEYPFSMKAATFAFPRRNRIIAGLSKATLVVEAPERSGALITAFLSLEYDREVLALPGSIFSANSAGCNNLIKLGATVVTSAKDVLETLKIKPKKEKPKPNLSPEEEKILKELSEPVEQNELIRKINLPAKEVIPILVQMQIKGFIRQAEDDKLYKIQT